MIEVVAALSAANSAFNALKAGIQKGQEIQDMAGTLSKFFEANDQISEANIENEETSTTAKLIVGKSIDEQALEIALAKRKAAQMEKDLRELLIYTGEGDTYREMLKQRRRLRQKRLEQARAAAKRKSDIIDIVVAIVGLSVVVGACIFMISLMAEVSAKPNFYL